MCPMVNAAAVGQTATGHLTHLQWDRNDATPRRSSRGGTRPRVRGRLSHYIWLLYTN